MVPIGSEVLDVSDVLVPVPEEEDELVMDVLPDVEFVKLVELLLLLLLVVDVEVGVLDEELELELELVDELVLAVDVGMATGSLVVKPGSWLAVERSGVDVTWPGGPLLCVVSGGRFWQ